MSFKKEIKKFKNIISVNNSPKFVTIKKICQVKFVYS